jgi:hypothetical protein
MTPTEFSPERPLITRVHSSSPPMAWDVWTIEASAPVVGIPPVGGGMVPAPWSWRRHAPPGHRRGRPRDVTFVASSLLFVVGLSVAF